ncbi:MAG: hypothetical protein HY646_15770, partial [Acidobacteria bacterium]|nr:hypothetical protein [Acidobacteriota bacterium]
MPIQIRLPRFHTAKLPVSVRSVLLCVMLAAIPGWAQTPEKQKPEEKSEAQQPAKTADREGFKWGLMEGRSEIEIGYRWISQAGNRDMYRSMINLGEGPKVLRSSLSLRSNYGSGTLFDRLDLSIDNWGGDPYNTMRLSFSRMDLYEFRATYRNLNYYNFIPSFSNPLLASGNMLGQHSLNVTHRTTDLELKLFPRSRVRPFVGYARSSGFGPGYTTFRSAGNEFLLDTRWQYGADDYRGGIELSLPRLTLTVEQGYRFLRNDTSVSRTDFTSGNNSRTFLGQKVVLDSLDRGYHDRTKIPFSKLGAKFAPWSQLELTARYVYSQASVDSTFSQIDAGNLISLDEMLAYQSAADSYNARAKRPGHTGGFTITYSPFSRLTLLNNFDSRSYHISGGAVLNTVYYKYRPLTGLSDGKSDRKVSHL